MPEIRKPAVKIQQGKHTLFLTSFTVRDFLLDNFYQIDRLDIREAKGQQRLLHEGRAKDFCKDIVEADECDEALLPTSVFLAASDSIGYDEATKELFFDSAKVCPFDVVDGQHRIKGLEYAVKDNEHLLDFPIAVVIAHEMSQEEKTLQFLTVNTKQKPVDQGISQAITARFTDMLEVEGLPYIPSWLKKEVLKGNDAKALDIALKFNSDKDSPWYQKIQFADETRKPQHTIRQKTFVPIIKRVILTRNHPLFNSGFEEKKRFAIFRNFWCAVNKICVDEDADTGSVVFQENGLIFFHFILAPILNRLARNRNYETGEIEKILLSARDDFIAGDKFVLSPEFWRRGGDAGRINRGGIVKLAEKCSEALPADEDDRY